MAQSDMSQEIEALKNDMASLREDLGKIATTLGEEAKGHSRAAYDDVRRRADAGIDTVERQIDEHPFTSMAAAFGIGLLIGNLFRR
ncbi:MAG: hypothetical protein R3360_09770, partial [Alphaproteobacteria bacterium]|nr:hypothetical protein [Alphaproteobacteria bacterium]